MVFFNGWNTSTETKLVVCVDKDWGVPGCRMSGSSVEGDWVRDGISTYNSSVETPYFYPVEKLTIVVTSPCYDYSIEVRDVNNNVLLSVGTLSGHVCPPVPFFVSTPTPTPTPTPSPTPTSTPTPTPTPTPTSGECPPVVRTGVDVLDRVLFCVGGVGVSVFVLVVVFLLVWLLLR